MATTTTTTTLAPGDEEDTGNASLILVASFAAAMVVVGFGSIIAICKYCEHRTSKAGRDAQRKALEKQTQQIKNAEMKRAAKIAKKKKEKDKEIIRELKKMGFTYDESALLIAQGNAQYFLDGPPEGDFDLPSIRKKRNKSNEVPIEPEMEVDDELEGVGDKARRDSWDPFAGLDDESEVIGERLRNKRTSRRTSNVKDAAATATSLFDDDTNSNSSKDSRVSITSGELEDPSDLIDDEPTVLCSLAGGKGAGGEQGDSDEGEDEREVEKEIIFDYTDSDEDDIYRRQQEKIRTSRRAPFMLNTRRALPKEDPFDTWDQLDAVLTNKEQQKKAALARRKKEEDAVLWEENRIRRRIAIVTKKPVAIDFEL